MYQIPEPSAPSPKDHVYANQKDFVFLYDTPEAKSARQNINAWIQKWPEQDDPKVEADLTANNNAFLSKVWELYVCNELRRLGFEVHCIPVIENCPTPDFLVSNNQERFIVEATLITHGKVRLSKDENFGKLLNDLQRLGHKDYVVTIEAQQIGVQTLSSRKVASLINDWLALLQDDSNARTLQIHEKDWMLNVSVLAKRSDMPFIGMISDRTNGFAISNEPLRAKLDDKASKYSSFEPELPRILFIAHEHGFPFESDRHVASALYGDEQLLLDTQSGETTPTRAPIGSFIRNGQWRKTDLDGLVYSPMLYLARPDQMSLTYWKHPASTRGLTPTFPYPTWTVQDDFLVKSVH